MQRLNEKEYYESIKGKYLSLFTTINDYQYRFNGVLLEVFDNGFLLKDRKIKDPVRIAFKDTTILNIKDSMEVKDD